MASLLNSVFESCALWEKGMSWSRRALTLRGVPLCLLSWKAKGLAMGGPQGSTREQVMFELSSALLK